MTCLEVQSKLIAYIDNNLEKDEKIDFLRHIQCCEECKEELDIYYTMIEGMRQLDGNMSLSKDFSEELNNRISRELKNDRKRRELFNSSLVIVIIGILGFFVFGYVNFLNLVHEEEQAKIKEKQGNYYFSDTFRDVLFSPDEEKNILEINVSTEEAEEEIDIYDKIKQYNMLK